MELDDQMLVQSLHNTINELKGKITQLEHDQANGLKEEHEGKPGITPVWKSLENKME